MTIFKKININYIFIVFLLGISLQLKAQEGKKIVIENAKYFDKNEEKFPGASILTGEVEISHKGVKMWCDKAYYYANNDFIKAFGNVRIKQGDTINMTSKYAEYSGETQIAFSAGDVRLTEPNTTLETDTLFFNRVKQIAYYRSGGVVRDSASVLTSNIGRYYTQSKKYQFVSEVNIKNPEYEINSKQMDYYADAGHAYMYGPSTITSETSTVYCERGFYDTRNDTGYFVKNSKIDYNNRTVKGDSLYFDRTNNFASATNNIKVIDTANNSIVRGHYAEVYREKDSVFITKRAVAVTLQEKDSVYIHGDTLMVTGKPENRIIRGFHNVRLFKSDMSGKADSVHVDQKRGLTKLIRKPIIWSGENQMTGDTIHLINNPETNKLDSLKVFYNVFLVQKDSINGFNQVKGKELYGQFNDKNELYNVDILKNTESIFYIREDDGTLTGIDKSLSSAINLTLVNNEIEEITRIKKIEGKVYPESQFPENARKLRGFIWRGEERLLTKDDLFKDDPPLELPTIKGLDPPVIEEQLIDDPKDTLKSNKNSSLFEESNEQAKKPIKKKPASSLLKKMN